MIPDTDINALQAAMSRFDEELRESDKWRGWEGDVRHKYAISHGDRLYPVKEIIRLAIGPGVPGFSGGYPANHFVERYGLEVVSLRNNTPASISRSWIFQANPTKFDIERALQALNEMSWLVTAYRNDIREGDEVFLWEAGPNAGILALASVTSPPAHFAQAPEDVQFNLDEEKFAGDQLRVRLHIDRVLGERISRKSLLDHPILKDLQIIAFANATNFSVTSEQAAALHDLVGKNPGTNEEGGVTPMSYGALLAHLNAHGLAFPEEVISNYLLALQTKRLVILTGISGTGKTQLALNVARYFQPVLKVPRITESKSGAIRVGVYKYMLNDHRMVLPAALTATLDLIAEDAHRASGKVAVVFPNGEATAAWWKESQRNVTHMRIQGAFRRWFDEHLNVGDSLLLEAIEAEDGVTPTLRLTVPEVEIRTEPLDNYRVVAVRPDWTDNRGLLGYYNPLTREYHVTPFLRLLLDARVEADAAAREGNESPHPFFAILDEMNLARVEHYFSDFLSSMESGEPLHLHDDPLLETGEDNNAEAVPKRLVIPPNIFFTGTVNVDETTYMFSPKVLDRAFTIEFNRVDLHRMGSPISPTSRANNGELSLARFPGALTYSRKPGTGDWIQLGDLLNGDLQRTVVDLQALLAADNRHFGYRVATEIARFVSLADEQTDGTAAMLWAALDLAILQKVLPKFHGTQQEMGETLNSIFCFAVIGSATPEANALVDAPQDWIVRDGLIVSTAVQDGGNAHGAKLPRTGAKVRNMLQRLQQQGFTSFIE